MPPLIELKVKLNDTLDGNAFYDPGSNISLINSKIVHIKCNKNLQKTNFGTINGVVKADGLIKNKSKIF